MLRHVTGSSGGPKISRIGRWFIAREKPALKTHLERLAVAELKRVIVSHHQVIEQPAVLREIAATLG